MSSEIPKFSGPLPAGAVPIVDEELPKFSGPLPEGALPLSESPKEVSGPPSPFGEYRNLPADSPKQEAITNLPTDPKFTERSVIQPVIDTVRKIQPIAEVVRQVAVPKFLENNPLHNFTKGASTALTDTAEALTTPSALVQLGKMAAVPATVAVDYTPERGLHSPAYDMGKGALVGLHDAAVAALNGDAEKAGYSATTAAMDLVMLKGFGKHAIKAVLPKNPLGEAVVRSTNEQLPYNPADNPTDIQGHPMGTLWLNELQRVSEEYASPKPPIEDAAIASADRAALVAGREAFKQADIPVEAAEKTYHNPATPPRIVDQNSGLVLDPNQTASVGKGESDLRVAAVGADGKTYIGDRGDLHFNLSLKYADKIREDANLKAGDATWEKVGWADTDGNFLTRQEALERTTVKPTIEGELDALDYREQRHAWVKRPKSLKYETLISKKQLPTYPRSAVGSNNVFQIDKEPRARSVDSYYPEEEQFIDYQANHVFQTEGWLKENTKGIPFNNPRAAFKRSASIAAGKTEVFGRDKEVAVRQWTPEEVAAARYAEDAFSQILALTDKQTEHLSLLGKASDVVTGGLVRAFKMPEAELVGGLGIGGGRLMYLGNKGGRRILFLKENAARYIDEYATAEKELGELTPADADIVNRRISAALQDRASAEKILSPSPAEHKMFRAAAGLLDYYAKERSLDGRENLPDYLTNMRKTAQDSDNLHARLSAVATSFRRPDAKSKFDLNREGRIPTDQLETNVGAVLRAYNNSMARDLAFRPLVDYIESDFPHDVNPARLLGERGRKTQTYLRDWLDHTLNGDHSGSSWLGERLANAYQSQLAWNIYQTIQNRSQSIIADMYVSRNASSLAKKLFSPLPIAKMLWQRDLGAGSTNAILNETTNAFLSILYESDQRAGAVREGRLGRIDPFPASERADWKEVALKGIFEELLKDKTFERGYKKAPNKVAYVDNYLLRNTVAAERAKRTAVDLCLRTQFSGSRASRPEVLRKLYMRALFMYFRFPTSAIQSIAGGFRITGADGSRAILSLARGDLKNAKAADLLFVAEMGRKGAKTMARLEKDPAKAAEYKQVERMYAEISGGLNKTLKEGTSVSLGKSSIVLAKYLAYNAFLSFVANVAANTLSTVVAGEKKRPLSVGKVVAEGIPFGKQMLGTGIRVGANVPAAKNTAAEMFRAARMLLVPWKVNALMRVTGLEPEKLLRHTPTARDKLLKKYSAKNLREKYTPKK